MEKERNSFGAKKCFITQNAISSHSEKNHLYLKSKPSVQLNLELL